MTTFLLSLKTNQLVLVSSCTPSGVIFCLLLQSIYLFFSKFWKCEIHFQNFQKYEINIPKFQIVQNYPQIRVYKGSPFYEKWSVYNHMGIAQTAFGYPPTMGQNHSFWLLKTSLIFQGISCDLDVNVLKQITMKILVQIKSLQSNFILSRS